MIDFFDEVDRFKWVLNSNNYTQLLINPEYLQAKVLPNALKDITIKNILSSKWYQLYPEKFGLVINNLQEDSKLNLWKNFKYYTYNLDQKRQESILKVFPELAEYYDI